MMMSQAGEILKFETCNSCDDAMCSGMFCRESVSFSSPSLPICHHSSIKAIQDILLIAQQCGTACIIDQSTAHDTWSVSNKNPKYFFFTLTPVSWGTAFLCERNHILL